ncbi:MBL fold metallo-hydrolase [Segetibacter sp. 3557_3]|uniref:MBL fold metallo-hydrolase n=1 Tax=Segetibacter sp. 3557_3 TaxID=2547429 RepID=UPI001058BFE1|nr:MBL fold metallo-hydrolase [Segetibacter sp. 3557_3]TDH24242.1 MBL fold metallo-hydrolase [Segetibacter sp. 3557_3]
MSLFISSLNSGSNGNCYYVGNHTDAILVDAGISCKEIERRLLRCGLTMDNVRAVFISHEHSDHIFGLRVLSRKYQLPVYITTNTLKHCNLKLEDHLVRSFSAHEPVTIGGLNVSAFPKFHDAGDPHSFIVEHEKVTVGVFTDIGSSCEQVIRYFKQCQAVFLEANYDEQMLASGSYPYFLKRRITGGKGHLSNREAVELFTRYRHPGLSHLILAHLSKNNNCPKLVEQLFRDCAGRTEVVIAPRYNETPVYTITNTGLPIVQTQPVVVQVKPLQLSMF